MELIKIVKEVEAAMKEAVVEIEGLKEDKKLLVEFLVEHFHDKHSSACPYEHSDGLYPERCYIDDKSDTTLCDKDSEMMRECWIRWLSKREKEAE